MAFAETDPQLAGWLNGVIAERGTVVGIEKRSMRFVVAGEADFTRNRTPLRYAKATEVSLDSWTGRVPRSVLEHKQLPIVSTVYGKAHSTTAPRASASVMVSEQDIRREARKVAKEQGMKGRLRFRSRSLKRR